jgi:hypothetical protein
VLTFAEQLTGTTLYALFRHDCAVRPDSAPHCAPHKKHQTGQPPCCDSSSLSSSGREDNFSFWLGVLRMMGMESLRG